MKDNKDPNGHSVGFMPEYRKVSKSEPKEREKDQKKPDYTKLNIKSALCLLGQINESNEQYRKSNEMSINHTKGE